MKGPEYYSPVLLFITLYKLALFSLWMIPKCERHWELLSSGTVYYAVEAESNLVLSLDEIIPCERSGDSY